eukprot:Amastigsp_a342369_6.p3 type:complete len:150 gc:universal Amastigsp_a342369_6:776-327(-)
MRAPLSLHGLDSALRRGDLLECNRDGQRERAEQQPHKHRECDSEPRVPRARLAKLTKRIEPGRARRACTASVPSAAAVAAGTRDRGRAAKHQQSVVGRVVEPRDTETVVRGNCGRAVRDRVGGAVLAPLYCVSREPARAADLTGRRGHG